MRMPVAGSLAAADETQGMPVAQSLPVADKCHSHCRTLTPKGEGDNLAVGEERCRGVMRRSEGAGTFAVSDGWRLLGMLVARSLPVADKRRSHCRTTLKDENPVVGEVGWRKEERCRGVMRRSGGAGALSAAIDERHGPLLGTALARSLPVTDKRQRHWVLMQMPGAENHLVEGLVEGLREVEKTQSGERF